ncbi:MAG: tetratricopeptide repeat protein [Pyrinomonadaceae bacterium]|nr:tetratricopeptide repeat protein [Pyrinomonadaceae bacterium]MCX7640316.1 tetratricopeptide repeat protein [Pyrinomonadaceae bacterium]MDW8304743.1 tetratricopeptide repeat protein [Acidobacteriota bacterium]
MRYFLFSVLILFLLFCQIAAQKPSLSAARKTQKTAEKEEFEKAIQNNDPEQKILALEKFLENYPETKHKPEALKLISEERLNLAEQKLSNKDCCEEFKKALQNLPEPVEDEFFAKNLLKIPNLLYINGYRNEAIEIAKLIEEKAKTNPRQLLSIATFYISIENGSEAQRLAEKALELEESSSGYQTLGLAHRLNFDLEAAEKAFLKASQLNTNSITAKRNLADVKRALGKPDEAAALYEQILQVSENNVAAQNGLILSLFDSGKIEEAEQLLQKIPEENKNFTLFASMAYKYALKKDAQKAISLADKAISLEPRYVWSYIAKARALLAQNKPLEAEKTLLTARQYGNFPTLNYELALAKFSSGFYNEVLDILEKNFEITENGFVRSLIGYRILKQAEKFSSLTAYEIRSSLLQPEPIEDQETELRLKQLFVFSKKLNSNNEEEALKAAEAFINGNDKTKVYRQIFVSDKLLKARKAVDKALEIAQNASENLEEAVSIDSPSSFVLSNALYESRKIAEVKGQMLLIQELPRQTLLNILRGRIEEIMGLAFYEQNRISDAIIRLKRAVSILPENSIWWRSSLWHLGTCYETNGELRAALDAYLKSYKGGEADQIRYITIENLYKRIYGSTDGLEQLIKSDKKEDFLLKRAEPAAKLEESTNETESKKTEQKVAEVTMPSNLQIEFNSNSTRPRIRSDVENKTSSKELIKPAEEASIVKLRESRPRIVVNANSETKENCSLIVGQKEVTILRNGGRLGVLVGYTDTKQDLSKLNVISGSPTDVKVEVEPEIAKNQLFIVIKSISEKTGHFKIFLLSPCGSAEIVVNVR